VSTYLGKFQPGSPIRAPNPSVYAGKSTTKRGFEIQVPILATETMTCVGMPPPARLVDATRPRDAAPAANRAHAAIQPQSRIGARKSSASWRPAEVLAGKKGAARRPLSRGSDSRPCSAPARFDRRPTRSPPSCLPGSLVRRLFFLCQGSVALQIGRIYHPDGCNALTNGGGRLRALMAPNRKHHFERSKLFRGASG
jgi:hypothetical protein